MPSLGSKFSDFIILIFPIFLLLLVWEVASRLQLINPVLFPSPFFKVLPRLYTLLRSQTHQGHSVLLTHIYYSLYRLLYGFGAGAIAGVCLGILMGMNKYVYGYFNPLISVMVPVPGIIWAPILILWYRSFGDPVIITVAFIASFFPIVYNTMAGVRSIDKQLIWASQIMGAKKGTIFLKVLLPWSIAYILTGLKLGLARGWRTLIAVEMIAASLWGLGYMIWDAKEYIRTDIIYGGILLLAALFFLIEHTVVRMAEKKTIEKWGMITEL